MMLASTNLSTTRARLSRLQVCTASCRKLEPLYSWTTVSRRQEWLSPVQQLMQYRGLNRGLEGAAEGSFVGGYGLSSAARRHVSNRAARSKTGNKLEVPSIPSFIEIRELATLLRMKPKEVFKSLGGYQERKFHRLVLGGTPYAFPKLGNIILPFEDVHALAKRLKKDIRFLDVEKKPGRVSLGRPVGSDRGSWEGSGALGRRPVVALLGHFNHGKTTILDALLGPDSGIAEREAGGITQEIRARTVSLETSQARDGDREEAGVMVGKVSVLGFAKDATFLDTPGQEIFYRMRTNGARVADAIVLVVSAVDGVCSQTSESIGCAEELGLPVVVVLNKVDLLPGNGAAERLADLSSEVREYVALEHAQVLPISARTGRGLDRLRLALGSILGRGPCPREGRPSIEDSHLQDVESEKVEERPSVNTSAFKGGEGADALRVSAMETPEDAATATVLDYVSSAKTGKRMVSQTLKLVLVDRGVLRPGDFFVSGTMWGMVRLVFDEEGSSPLQSAGPGVAAKVAVVSRTSMLDAPLGEPFRVLTEKAAEKVALVRVLARTIINFVDHRRLESDFPHLLDGEEVDGAPLDKERENTGERSGASDCVAEETIKDVESSRAQSNMPKRLMKQGTGHDELAQEDMPVTIVVKADSANTLASILDALDDWSDLKSSEDGPGETSSGVAVDKALQDQGNQEQRNGQLGESDLQHKPRQRLLVSVARSGIGAVTSSDVRIARDCECPVFAHGVTTDASASRELKRAGGGIIKASPEGTAWERETQEIGQEGFIGRAGEGRECVVVSETVGELLGEIERFVLRVR